MAIIETDIDLGDLGTHMCEVHFLKAGDRVALYRVNVFLGKGPCDVLSFMTDAARDQLIDFIFEETEPDALDLAKRMKEA